MLSSVSAVRGARPECPSVILGFWGGEARQVLCAAAGLVAVRWSRPRTRRPRTRHELKQEICSEELQVMMWTSGKFLKKTARLNLEVQRSNPNAAVQYVWLCEATRGSRRLKTT